jgi:hypothetical protein
MNLMTVEYKQWVVTDRTTLMTVIQQSDEECIENLVSKILELTHHHYTAKQQASYLKGSKENLQSDH